MSFKKSFLMVVFSFMFSAIGFAASTCTNDTQCQGLEKCLPRFGAERTCIQPLFPFTAGHDYETLGKGEDMALCNNDSECDDGLKCLMLRGQPKKCYRTCTDTGSECSNYKGPGFVMCREPGMVAAPAGMPNPGKLCMIVCGGTIPPCMDLPTRDRCDGTCPNAGKCAVVGEPIPAMRCI